MGATLAGALGLGRPPAPAPVAKVFVATMRVGNVGITLTAASRVYLIEPCLDPAMELQAITGSSHSNQLSNQRLFLITVGVPWYRRRRVGSTGSARRATCS